MGAFSQMAAQLQSIVPDPSMVGPMLTAAVTGMASNYASSKLGRLNPMDKIEQVVTKKLDNSRVGRWVNNKIDQASDYMDRKLGNNTETITPELRSAIGSEVTTQLNARGVGTRSSSVSSAGGSSGSSSTPSTPSSPPSSSTGGSGGASGGGHH